MVAIYNWSSMYRAPAIGFARYGGDLLETDSAVHRDRIFHDGFDGVEAHALVADLAGFGDDAVGQESAQSLAAELRAQIEALHLADLRFELVQSDAARELAFVFGEQQAAFGWSIVAGEFGEFLVEVLEAEAEAEGLRVFEEEFAGLGDLGRGFRLRERQTFHHRGTQRKLEKHCVRLSFLCVLSVLCG